MTIQHLAGLRIAGQSTDTKPTNLDNELWTFEERDTGRKWNWNGTEWIQDGYIEEVANKIIDGSPLIRLIGDEFAANAESSLYLLEDLTSKIGGGVLTNNNTATFPLEGDLPLRGFNVVSLDGVDQFLSRATEAQFEVGTGSFIVSCWFKTTTKDVFQNIVTYGTEDASEQNWILRISSVNTLEAIIDDGTNIASVGDTIADRFQDGKWHCAKMLVDRTTNIMYLYVDGQELSNVSISAVTGTLNNVGEDFIIGAREFAAAKSLFFNGQLANFHLIKAADYNAVQVLNQGIRESVSIGTHSLAIDALKRLNNEITLGTTLNDYITTVIDVEEGTYELQSIYEQNTPSFGTFDIEIDNKQVDSVITLGTLADNSLATETGIKLSAGKHILKIKDTLAGQISINWINLIKREGHEQGGATKFLFLYDEISQRLTTSSIILQASTTRFYNNQYIDNPSVTGEFFEGDIFIKGGLWEIIISLPRNTDRAAVNLDFGDVEVLDEDTIFNGALDVNFFVTKSVRLNQGRNTIRLETGSTAGGAVTGLVSIRGERISD